MTKINKDVIINVSNEREEMTMKVRNKNERNLITVEELSEGDFFLFKNRLFMIANGNNNMTYCFDEEEFFIFDDDDEMFERGGDTEVEQIFTHNIEIIIK